MPRAAFVIRQQRWLLLLALIVCVAGLTGVAVALGRALSAPFASQVDADLEWRALRGARELSKTAALDGALVAEALRAYAASPDVEAIAVEVGDMVVASRGTSRAFAPVFAAEPGQLVRGDGYLASWAAAATPGAEVGKVAIVVSTRRLAEAQAMQRRLSYLTLIAGGAAAVLGVLIILLLTRRAPEDVPLAGALPLAAASPLPVAHILGQVETSAHESGPSIKAAGESIDEIAAGVAGAGGVSLGDVELGLGDVGLGFGGAGLGDGGSSLGDAGRGGGTGAGEIRSGVIEVDSELADQLEERTRELDERTRALQLVLDHAAQGFLLVDLAGRLTGARSAIVDRWFGEPAGDATLASYLGAHGDELAGQLRGGIESIVEGVETVADALAAMPKRIVTAAHSFDVSYAPLMNGERPEQILLILSIVQDVAPIVAPAQVTLADEDEPRQAPEPEAVEAEPPKPDPAAFELTPVVETPEQREQRKAEDEQRERAALTQLITGERAEFDEFFAEAAGLVAALRIPGEPDAELRTLRTLRDHCAYYGLAAFAELCQVSAAAPDEISDELRAAIMAGWAKIEAQVPASWADV